MTVTPLRSKGTIAELPWLGLGIPVAMGGTVVDSGQGKMDPLEAAASDSSPV